MGTNHTSLHLTDHDAIDAVTQISRIYDEPFADSSQIPTILLCQLTRKYVKVSLSGDGGDELFGGYSRYFRARKWFERMNILSSANRSILACAAGSLSAFALFLRQHLDVSSTSRIRYASPDIMKLRKIIMLLGSDGLPEFYRHYIAHWSSPSDIVLSSREQVIPAFQHSLSFRNPIEEMMYYDSLFYLPDDILCKVDRASMAASLEVRAPLLDHRIAEFSWSLPFNLKIRSGKSKWILHQILHKFVPQELVDRPKKGFSVPLASWLRGPLRDWSEALLNESRLLDEGFFNPSLIRQLWSEHLSGARDRSLFLWDVLMFQAWLDSNH